MAFTLPNFNLTANVWHYATWFGQMPGTIPVPDFTTACNLALGKRQAGASAFSEWLLLPALTDVRDKRKNPTLTPQGDVVEVPAGSGRYYAVVEVDDIGKGFANEHRFAICQMDPTNFPQLPLWPEPYP